MLISYYSEFVAKTDLSKDRPDARFDIAVYGLVGEIGSLVAAIKKRLLAAGRKNWSAPNDEIIEELGDSLWYCFAVGAACGLNSSFLASDVVALQIEVGGTGARSEKIRRILGRRASAFLEAAPEFVAATNLGTATLDDYRRLTFLTSRTEADQLVEVSLAVLQQLTAELLRLKLPAQEKDLNQSLLDRPVEVVLGETIWHMAALASLYGLELDKVAERNIAKLERRFGRGEPTPLHDEGRTACETLPRRFEVCFVGVGPGRSRMYMNGHRLGDDLTDNAYQEDGYRFHDVMHLALVAKLGWSPVLRKLLGRKRKSDPDLDEVEDGARAQIVEEAVIKAIHAEGVRVAALMPGAASGEPQPLFANSADMSFNFLKRLEMLVSGLEVESSHYWEWEDAILDGFKIFDQLRSAGRGTVVVDLSQRSITFLGHAFVDLAGTITSIGSATAKEVSLGDPEVPDGHEFTPKRSRAAIAACREAILNALGIDAATEQNLFVAGWRNDLVDIKVAGLVQATMWDRGVIAFRAVATERLGSVDVAAFAIGDV
jgi:NTP pyrophosphatase (non-canonical NTP hydrolase)